MSTIINLSEQELIDLHAFTKEADPASAVRIAMLEYLRFARRMRLKELSGTVTMEENWPELEAAELRKSNGGQ